MMRKSFSKSVFLILIALIFLSFSRSATCQGSAFFYLSPATGNYSIEKSFAVKVLVNSTSEAINAGETTIKFDPAILKVKSISRTGSIFNFWAKEPTFSNSAGTIKFVGGSPTSYKGTNGLIITIYFQGKKEGKATVSFLNSRIAASGLDVTGESQGGVFNIVGIETKPTPVPTPTGGPSAPKISSPTHPDSSKWYNNSSPKFEWQVPENVTAVKLGYGKSPKLAPFVLYEPPVSSKQLEEVGDGVFYFVAQFKNREGWGEIGRFKFQVDTTPPEPFTVLFDNQGDPTNPGPSLTLKAEDKTSGIDYYEIVLNDQTFVKVKPEELKNGVFKLPPLDPGNYVLDVKAFDKAGNSTSGLIKSAQDPQKQALASLNFSISPIPLESVKVFPSKVKEGSSLIIEGKTLPEVTINIYFQKEKEQPSVRQIKSDQTGYFKLEQVLPVGKYFVWLQAEDGRGAKSRVTEKYPIEVVKERFILYLSIFLAILILIGIFIIFFIGRRILRKIKETKKEEIKKVEDVKMKAYNILRERIKNQISELEEKVDLSRSEMRILESLKKALKETENILKEETEK